jgi:hypothetical protein
MRKRSREQATATERSEKRVILYHRTTRDKAGSIKVRGFIDATGTYLTDQEFSGVWVSDVPLDANEGAHGDALFEITLDVPEAALTFVKLPSPNRLLRPTNTLADIFYQSAQPNPATNKSRIAHAKPIAPPRPPRQRLRTNPPIASAPAGHSRVHAATTAPAHLSIGN